MTRSFKTLLLVLALSTVFTACVDQRKVMDSWIDKEEYQLIEKWGPPTRTASNGSDGQILIYDKPYYQDGGTLWYKHTMFYTYANGIIYHWLIQNSAQPARQLDLHVYRH